MLEVPELLHPLVEYYRHYPFSNQGQLEVRIKKTRVHNILDYLLIKLLSLLSPA